MVVSSDSAILSRSAAENRLRAAGVAIACNSLCRSLSMLLFDEDSVLLVEYKNNVTPAPARQPFAQEISSHLHNPPDNLSS